MREHEPNITPRVHTAEQAAELLQCKVSWLVEQARRRRIPFTMIGGSYRFTDRHLERIIAQFEQEPQDAISRKPAPKPRKEQPPAGVVELVAKRPRRSERAS